MRPDTLFKADCKSIKCRKRLLLSQVKCIFALKESFFDRGKRKQNIVIRSFLNRYLTKRNKHVIICISIRKENLNILLCGRQGPGSALPSGAGISYWP